VLPLCTPYLGPRLILVLNNAFSYRTQRVRELYKEASVLLEFLPLYSPDFNPIKATFNNLKT
ncbi:hypothetical protein BU23DRAFT_494541, partial [Bimuria novae-zelandiae CBS 107.79]